MAQPYVGEIRMFGGNFAPMGWAFCDGSLLPISENETLFSLIGTTYGGDGQSTFALPDLRGRVPIHMGSLPGGSTYILGQNGGTESVTLVLAQLPAHNHLVESSTQGNPQFDPNNAAPSSAATNLYRGSQDTPIGFSSQAVGPTGGSQPHDNIQPILTVSYIISLFGIYPTQN
jgi:microcystin-dependent protein